MVAVLLFVVVVGGSIALSVLILQLFRRKVPTILKSEDHQIAGHFLGVVGGFYGVLLAFVVVLIWGQFNEAKVIVTREANQAGDLFRLSRGLPGPAQQRMRESLVRYQQVVTAKEWADMATHRECAEAWAALDDLWTVYRDYQPQTPAQLQIYQLSLARLVDLTDARRLRLLYSREKVPGILWALLIGGGVATISFTYLFRLEHVRVQAIMTGIVAGLIAFILFLVMDFDQPFSGIVRIRPEMFSRELQRMHVPTSAP